MLRYTDDIRSKMSTELVREIADSYAYAYGIPLDDGEIQGMIRAADNFDKLSDEFLYWFYATSILEGIAEDEDGYRDDDYMFDLNVLCGLLGGSYPITDKPTALAYARSQLVLSAPNTSGWLARGALEEDAKRFRTGLANWDDVERMASLAETMWRNLIIY